MTFRKPTERIIGARALTDPKPAFVSIVKAGANQVPFRSTKADASTREKALQERIEAMRIAGMEVSKIAFERGEHFADIDAVKSWLAEGGYEIGEIAEKDDGFEVENGADTFEEGSVVQIDAGSVGVTIWVGKLDAESAAKRDGEGGEPRGKVIEVEVTDKKGDDEPAAETRTGKGGEPTPAEKIEADGDPGSAGDAATAEKDDERPVDGDAPAAKAEGAEEPGGGGSGGAPEAAEESTEKDVTKAAISYATAHKGGTPAAARDAAWDAGAERAAADVSDLKVMAAWRADKADADLTKGDFKLLHHKAAGQHAVVFKALGAAVGVLNGGRGGVDIPSADRQGAYNHIAKHYRDDFDAEPPALASKADYEGNLALSRMISEALTRKSALYGDEMAQRFDDFMAHFSEALTVGEVMADANDGIPVGFGEAIQSMVVAMRNNLVAGNVDGARTAAVDFGDLVVALVNAMSSVQDKTQRAERCKRAIDLFAATLPKEEKETKETAGAGEQDAVLRAISDLAATVAGNHASTEAAINEVMQRVEGVEQSAAKTEAGLSERVGALEAGKQTRKSADATDEGGGAGKRKKGPIDGLAFRSALGISNVTRDGGF